MQIMNTKENAKAILLAILNQIANEEDKDSRLMLVKIIEKTMEMA
jgi:hypothetical protein